MTTTPTGHPATVRWTAEGWDAPAPSGLRRLMDTELAPRYAPFEHRRVRPPQPVAEEILITWVGYAGRLPVATASLRALPDRVEVKRVFVVPGYRGSGLAKAALTAVETTAAERGTRRLWLQTGELQPEAQGLYVRAGWQRVPAYPPYEKDPFSICFAKSLVSGAP
ncbi:GNAT family N-acetyltransferase [Streptomyces sp. NPDC007088]|uniref:GNAT family N-acetyltransferase n=1 Tax=Streptomyces sp. NPDC007088 TaxID=3364773 RepID=UPI0036AD74A1